MTKVDYKPLNRRDDWTVQQKASIKKIFLAAESAATKGDSTLVSRTFVHNALAGNFDGDHRHDIQALMKEVRAAINNVDNTRSIDSVVGSFRMGGHQRRVLRVMANDVISQIV
jgi:hypothetical protein